MQFQSDEERRAWWAFFSAQPEIIRAHVIVSKRADDEILMRRKRMLEMAPTEKK